MGFLGRFFKKEYNPNDRLSDRCDAVKKLKDQDKLMEILKTDNHEFVRKEAIYNITNQEVIREVAINDKSWVVRLNAVRIINDTKFLAEIAKNDEDSQVYLKAIEKIDDEKLLADIAKNAKENMACEKATSKITDESILIDIVKNAKSGYAIEEAVKKIKNQDVLIDIVQNSQSEVLARDALSNITDESVLEDAVKNNPDKFARREAISKISNIDVLRHAALNDEDHYVRRDAVEKISDDYVLWEVILNDSEADVRKKAYEKTIKCNNFNQFISNSSDFYNEDLLEFEKLNYTTYSIYDLGNYDILIIDSKGNNYTSWDDYKPMIYRIKRRIKNQIEKDERINPWASGHDDVSYSDDILFISENFKNKYSLPRFEVECETVGHGLFLNPTTDSRTEKGIYSLCHLLSLKALVINELNMPNISNDHFDKCNARTIYFNKSDVGGGSNINFKNCENVFGLD